MQKAIKEALSGRRRASHSAALALGAFSIALGLAEVLAPRLLARSLGVPGREDWIRAFGAREIATGLGIFAMGDRAPWLWARVAGDALDLSALGAAFRGNRHQGMLAFAAASVLGVTLADIATAQVLSELRAKDRTPYRDYRDRVGIRRRGETAEKPHAAVPAQAGT